MNTRLRSSATAACIAAAAAIACPPAHAWGAGGHHAIAAVAARLIASTPAAARVEALLGGTSLEDAAVWADCAKGIDAERGYVYAAPGRYPECRVFETAAGVAAMADYVRRNDTACSRRPGEASCHRQYHYTDIPVQRDRYDPAAAGARDDDLVAAIGAAIRVLQGRPSPAPFRIAGRREALLLLAHLVGDVHQPLHVGAVYLDRRGRRVDPGAGRPDPRTVTRGGNDLVLDGDAAANLHALWDAVPASLRPGRIDEAALVARARAVPATAGPVADWPAAWAGDTVRAARRAFKGVKFGAEQGGRWPVTLPARYAARMDALKRRQVAEAGAHLARLLQAALGR